MDAEFLKNTFFPIVRAGLDLPSRISPEAPDDPRLSELGARQAILPLLREGLRKLGVAGEHYERINSACMHDIFLFAQRDIALQRICTCFDDSAVPYVLLKGSSVRTLYPEPWMRTSSDVDILIREEDIDRASAALEAGTDLHKLQRNYHDVLFTNGIVHLELHFSIMETMAQLDGTLAHVWDYCVPVDSSAKCEMRPAFEIFHTVAHMVYHLTHGGLGVRPYLDLWLLRNKKQFDEQEVRKLCETCGVLRYYETACALSEVWLEGREHTELTAALESLCFDGGVFGSDRSAAALGIREQSKAGFLLRRLFPPKSTMAEQYPVLKTNGALLPVYYGKRLLDGVFRKRKTGLGELRRIKNASAEDVRSLDELLQKLGL